MSTSILVAVKDLLFGSKIQEAGKRTGTPLMWAPRFTPLRETVASKGAQVLIVDLGEPGVLDELRAIRATAPALRIIGFTGHVNVTAMDEAEAMGIGAIYSRGQFSAQVEKILLAERGESISS